MRSNIYEEKIEDFKIRLFENGTITDFNYTPTNIEEIWENVERYLAYCKETKPDLKVTIETAFEYTDTPFWVFSDDRTQELISLYFAMKQNPMFLFGDIENTPTIWIESTGILNTLWS